MAGVSVTRRQSRVTDPVYGKDCALRCVAIRQLIFRFSNLLARILRLVSEIRILLPFSLLALMQQQRGNEVSFVAGVSRWVKNLEAKESMFSSGR